MHNLWTVPQQGAEKLHGTPAETQQLAQQGFGTPFAAHLEMDKTKLLRQRGVEQLIKVGGNAAYRCQRRAQHENSNHIYIICYIFAIWFIAQYFSNTNIT
ncbi:MAG: hypothetical protein RSD99_17520 [Janthinobacterium sp.]